MSLGELKNNLFGKKNGSIEESMYVVMKEFGYTIQELSMMPLPTFYFLLHFLAKEAEKNSKPIKGKGGRRR